MIERRIQASIRTTAARGRDVERVGPFLATFDPHDDLKYLSYAIPDDGARPSLAHVEALVAAFRARDRLPRLEYLPAVAPDVEAALLAGGFAEEARVPLMTCEPAGVVAAAVPDGVEIGPPTADDAEAMLAVQHAAFGQPPPDRAAVERLADRLDEGRAAVVARADGAVVGAAEATAPAEGVTEIAGVAVDEAHRRRGIAGALTAAVTALAFEHGAALAFLTPGDEGAERVYARAGFVAGGVMLHVSVA
ncbi:MAG TPA: GNAT family N-acetyltransferase [Solirubrobacteraceae bacterium]